MYPVEFTSNSEMKLNDTKAEDILKPKLDALTAGKPIFQPVDPIQFVSTGPVQGRIKSDGYVYGYTNDPQAGGTKITPWRTSDNGMDINGTGIAFLSPDGTMGYEFKPAEIDAEIPEKVKNFAWSIRKTGGDSSVTVSLGSGNKPMASAPVPPIYPLGSPYTIDEDEIYKHEGVKTLGTLLGDGGLLTKLNLGDTPLHEVLLRIERGENESGLNAEYRVNYRFLYNLNGNKRFEVDQIKHGVNRIRLRNVLKKGTDEFLDALKVNLVAWTNFEVLSAVPVLAIKIDERHKIDIEKPRVEKRSSERENWYLRVKNGRFKRRIRLPYYEPEERVPQLYLSNPELVAYRPQSAGDSVEVVLDYSIPEYENQEFTNLPTIVVEKEYPVVLNEQMIQVQFRPIVLASEEGVSYLEVNASRINNNRRLRVSDVDAEKGIIYLHDRIRDQDEITVRYAYREDWYTYRGFYSSDNTEVIDVGSPVDLEVRYHADLHAEGIITEQTGGGSGTFTKALILTDNESEYTITGIFSQMYHLLLSKGLAVDQDKWTISKVANYKDYDLIIVAYMMNPVPAECVAGIRSFIAAGGSAIITAEHSGLTDWNANFLSIVSQDFPDLTLVPDAIVTTSGTFNTSHPLAQGCTSFTMQAASYYRISGSRIQPVAYSNGLPVVAAYENDKQRIVFMTDCNAMDDERGFQNPGNRRMIENILSWTSSPVYNDTKETKDAYVSNKFTTTIPSKETAFDQRIKVASIALYTDFGNEMKQFIDKYKAATKLTLTPMAAIEGATLVIVKSEFLYQSDGKAIGQREASFNDVIDIYVTVTVPVVMKDQNKLLRFFHMDFNPTPGHSFTLGKNSFHRWVPVNEKVEEYAIIEAPGSELLVRQINVYLKPTGIWLATETSTDLIAGTLKTASIYHTDEDYWFNPKDGMFDSTMLRLGRVFVQANSDIYKDMVILDTRSRGGGLDEQLSREIIARVNKESLHHWDIGYFDGEAYQENGVMIIHLPRKLLETFTESQIQASIAKHKAYGLLPIIEYHDEDDSLEVTEI
ncbi:hypothetical protein GZH47_32565 (plasmid) [Paenibacillus rhizovicinus]|nr:hypothetical protein [Paenibacillus rhizovicinus]QHW35633.1 hypothetical protein GZH47_32565 [Paenibacillus rhizovicinus]